MQPKSAIPDGSRPSLPTTTHNSSSLPSLTFGSRGAPSTAHVGRALQRKSALEFAQVVSQSFIRHCRIARELHDPLTEIYFALTRVGVITHVPVTDATSASYKLSSLLTKFTPDQSGHSPRKYLEMMSLLVDNLIRSVRASSTTSCGNPALSAA